jgi:hypothetical protein
MAKALAALGSARSFSEAERIQLAIAPGVASTLLALNVALAVYKPRARLQRLHPSVLDGRLA